MWTVDPRYDLSHHRGGFPKVWALLVNTQMLHMEYLPTFGLNLVNVGRYSMRSAHLGYSIVCWYHNLITTDLDTSSHICSPMDCGGANNVVVRKEDCWTSQVLFVFLLVHYLAILFVGIDTRHDLKRKKTHQSSMVYDVYGNSPHRIKCQQGFLGKTKSCSLKITL